MRGYRGKGGGNTHRALATSSGLSVLRVRRSLSGLRMSWDRDVDRVIDMADTDRDMGLVLVAEAARCSLDADRLSAIVPSTADAGRMPGVGPDLDTSADCKHKSAPDQHAHQVEHGTCVRWWRADNHARDGAK